MIHGTITEVRGSFVVKLNVPENDRYIQEQEFHYGWNPVLLDGGVREVNPLAANREFTWEGWAAETMAEILYRVSHGFMLHESGKNILGSLIRLAPFATLEALLAADRHREAAPNGSKGGLFTHLDAEGRAALDLASYEQRSFLHDEVQSRREAK